MQELDLATIFLNTMPPSSNSVQEEIKFYLQEYADKVNDEIFSSPRFRDRAAIISSMIIELRSDVNVNSFCRFLAKKYVGFWQRLLIPDIFNFNLQPQRLRKVKMRPVEYKKSLNFGKNDSKN